MSERDAVVAAVLAPTPWAGWRRAPLAGDASHRRYLRLFDPAGAGTVVLMDAPPARGEDAGAFLRVAEHLRGLSLAAPEVRFADVARGILILEDFGDGVFARLADEDPGREAALYAAGVDVLVALHAHPAAPGLPRFAPPFDPEFIALAQAWYRPNADGRIPAGIGTFCDALNAALLAHAGDTSVTILRDYHAENLIWRDAESGLARVGLLDFQDAMAGPRAYDLVSLVQDARRDVSPATRDAAVSRYLERTGIPAESFRATCAVLGAQRNLRILGVFARLSLHFGKLRYVDLIPRVWAHLIEDLAHPALAGLRDIVLAGLPAPTPDHLNQLRARCATVPRP